MVKSVDFAVRDSMGGITRGLVTGEGASDFIQVGAGDEVSLNLRKTSIFKYMREGDDLQIMLADGRTITLSGYYDAHARLYISSDGELTPVTLEDGGNGVIYADYGQVEVIGKWSPNDQLAFLGGDEILSPAGDDTTGMAMFAPAMLGMGGLGAAGAGLAGLGLLGLGGGGSKGGGEVDPIVPTVDTPDAQTTLTTNTEDPAATVSGTGEPGSTVEVVLGDQTLETTIDEDGTWSVTFEDDTFPSDGDLTSTVDVTAPDGTEYTLDGPDFLIDMTPPAVVITEGALSTGDVENLSEYQDGITVRGTGEAGAAIVVAVAGHAQATTVAADGSWSVTFTTEQMPAGTYSEAMTVTATDAVGNVTTLNDTLVVDTEASVAFSSASVTGDNIVNADEAQTGFALSGTSEPGSVSVRIELGGTSYSATPAADGTWSIALQDVALATGVHTATVTATDANGNTASATRAISFDTDTSVSFDSAQAGGNNLLNAAERSAGLVLTGTAEPGATVVVAFEQGSHTVTAGADGHWSASFAASEVRTGTYSSTATVTATDIAGNVATASHTINVDTEVQNFTHTSPTANAIVADDIVNAREAAGGLVVTGTVEPGATVTVQLASGSVIPAINLGNGSWTATIPAAQLPAVETDNVTLTVRATDVNGNTATQTSSIDFDPVVRNFAPNATVAGDGIVNAQEGADGFVISGAVEPGSRVAVTLASGAVETVTAGANGQWSVMFHSDDLGTTGSGTMGYQIAATDPVGNSATASGSFGYDLVAPESPDIIAFTRDAGSLLGIRTDLGENTYEIAAVDAAGRVTGVPNDASVSTHGGYGTYDFYSSVPNGSYLVVSDHDTAGNETSTLLVVDNTSAVTVDLARSGLGDFDFGTIDLTFAPEAQLTITEAQLVALTGPDHALVIQGDSADHVTALGADDSGQNTVIGGHTYSVYTLGDDGASLIIDDQITHLTI